MSPHEINVPSPSARQLLEDTHARICNSSVATLLWERVFALPEREALGGDLGRAYAKWGVPQMWMKLRGGTRARAVVDIAFALESFGQATRDWLLREIGDAPADGQESLQRLAQSSPLLLVDHPRALHWQGEEVGVAWNDHPMLWQYLETLIIAAKRGVAIERYDLGEDSSPHLLKHRKYQLGKQPQMPASFLQLIEAQGGTHRLKVPAVEIQIYERGPQDEYVLRRL